MLQTYLDLTLAIARVKERAGLAVDDVSQDGTINDLLVESAGKTEFVPTVYRPYFVAARILEQDTKRQQLKKAGTAEFTGLAVVIKSLFSQQASIDSSLSLIIPPGMVSPTDGEGKSVRTWASGSVPVSVVF